MRLYAVVVTLVWTGPYLSQVSGDLNYASQGLTQVPGAVDNGNLDTNQLKVDLSGNQLSTFDNNLTCCTQISTLDLSNNALTDVVIGRTSNLVITILTLSNNNLQNSPRISTAVANTLTEIYLNDNSLTSLDPALLADLVNLDKISLVRNSFSAMPDFTASKHTLTSINFEGNQITNCTSMHTINALQRIDIKLNSLQAFPQTMGIVNQVTSFNLFENQIQVVPNEDLVVFGALEYMDISRNRLTQFPNISLVGNTLQYLYMWGNTISSIDPSNFNNVQALKYLSMAGNGLTNFPDMGPTIGQTLQTLDLNHNALSDSTADNFYNLQALTLLDLNVNSFTKVPNISTSNAVTLQLSRNNINSAGLSTLSGKKISTLDLSENSITSLSGLTGLEATLTSLNLNGNPVASIAYSSLSGYNVLNTLDLSSTSLSSIPDLTNLQPLLTLKLESIPLVCDCTARWLTLWTTSSAGRTLAVSANPCQQPPNLVNVAWASVQLDECPVVTTTESITTSESIIVTTAAVEATTALIITTQDTDVSTAGQAITTQDTSQISTEYTTTSSANSTYTTTAVATSSTDMTTAVAVSTGCHGNAESTLITNLLSNYDKSGRPVLNQSEAVVVKFGLALQQIMSLNEREQELTIKAWMRYTWKDESLTWNTSQNCDISNVRIYPDRIWRPDITLYDDLNTDPNDNDAKMFPAEVQSDGSVMWNVPKMISSNCDVDMRYYPWDEQKCTLKFSSWSYDGSALDLTNKSASGDLTYFTTSGEWNVIEFSVKRNNILYNCCPNPYPDVTFTLHIRRKGMYYLFNLILPAIFITATTILVFHLPPESGEKVSLGVTVLLTLTVILLLVAESVPKTDIVPLIGQYFQATIIMMALSCALTVITLNVHHRGMFGKDVPYWVRKLVLDWMARPLCLKSKIDENLSALKSNKVWPKMPVDDEVGCEDGVILVQESKKTEEINIIKHDRTDTEQSLQDILGVLRGFQEGKRSEAEKEACKTDWKLVAMVMDRFLLYVFLIMTAVVTVIILSNRPFYSQPIIA